MLMPSIFGRDFMDDFFTVPFGIDTMTPVRDAGLMKTDVKEKEDAFDLIMNLPGVKKEDVKAELKNGYLTISAETNQEKDEKDDDGKYVLRERHFGSAKRSFYVGKDVKQEDIKAKFEEGLLKLEIPKITKKPEVEEDHYIAIEG